MGTFTQSDVNKINNTEGDFYFRAYQSSDSYTKTVFANGASFTYTPENSDIVFDNTGQVAKAISKEVGEIKFSIGTPYDSDYLQAISGGLFSKTTTSAGATVVEDQVIPADWTDKKNVTVDLVSSAGVYYKADGEPAITSVTGATASVLTVNDDYTIVVDGNSKSGYAILLNTAGTAGLVTTEAVTIVYNDPTVVATTTTSVGGKTNYGLVEGYFETVLYDNTVVRVYIHKAQFNGNWNVEFATKESAEPVTTEIMLTADPDTTRTIGDQVFTIVEEN